MNRWKKVRIRLIFGFLIALMLLNISEAMAERDYDDYAFESDNHLRYNYFPNLKNRVWKDNTLKWWYNPSDQVFDTERTVQAIQYAAATWERVSGIKFVYMGITDQALSDKGDDKFIIGWIDGITFMNRFGTFLAAYTHIWWNASNIYDGEISLNADLWKIKYDYSDLQGIMTHELGHAMGLAHSDDSESIMYVPYHSTQYQKTLREDDINAARALYPMTGSDSCFPVDDSLNIMVTCAEYKGIKYRFILNYTSDLYWKMDSDTLADSEGKNCILLDDDLALNIPCAEYQGNNYSFIMNYSVISDDLSGIYWKIDLNTFKKADSL